MKPRTGSFDSASPKGYLPPMGTSLKAEVRGGRLVLDEPTNLPDGTIVEFVEVSTDPFSALPPEERAQLNASIDRGLEEALSGRVQSSDDLLSSL